MREEQQADGKLDESEVEVNDNSDRSVRVWERTEDEKEEEK